MGLYKVKVDNIVPRSPLARYIQAFGPRLSNLTRQGYADAMRLWQCGNVVEGMEVEERE